MKPPRLLLLPASLLIIFSYLSCSKSDNPKQNGYKTEYITTTIAGRVTDANNKPVSNALVKAGHSSATTNIDGAFNLIDVNIDKNAGLIKVEKDGFFLGTKTIIASASNNNNQVAIRLIRKTVSGNISGLTGGAVTVQSNGGSIVFGTNSFIDVTENNVYTGAVAVSAFFINPEAPDFNDIMPGTLRGLTTNDQETGLQSFGMIAVELTGASGVKLQLAPGKTAILHFPIPASLQGEAPATIPLWNLDETKGLWREEGHATRQGNEYIGTVSHFSFWNCDAPFPVLDFKGIIRNQQGVNMDGVEVVILIPPGSSTAGSVSGTGVTNADGIITGKLPANKVLKLKVYNKCQNLLHIQDIGPFTSTTDLGVITISTPTSSVTIAGTVKNCSNAAVTSGFVSIKLENVYYNVPVTNGNFTTTISRCSNETVTASLIAYDEGQQTSGREVNLTVSGSTINAGNLIACGSTADTYLRYMLDGVSYQLSPPDSLYYFTGGQSNTITYIGGFRQGQAIEDAVIMFTGPMGPGPHTGVITDFYFGGPALQWMASDRFNVDVTEYGTGPGGYLMGTFSGTVRDSAGTKTAPLNFSFRVKKQ